MAISLENLYVIILGLKVYVCPDVDVFNYISVQGKGQSAHSYLPSTNSVVLRSLKSFFFFHSFLTVIHFHASWAAQCAQMNDVMTELAKDNTHVKFYKVNVTLIYNPLTLRTSFGKIICLPNVLICGRNPVLNIIQNVKNLW